MAVNNKQPYNNVVTEELDWTPMLKNEIITVVPHGYAEIARQL